MTTTTTRDADVESTIHLLSKAGRAGLDRNELGQALRPGQVNAVQTSGPILVGLHAQGRVACLAERVDGRYVYVLPGYVDGRATRPYKRKNVPVGDLEALMEKYGQSVPSYDLRLLIEENPYA